MIALAASPISLATGFSQHTPSEVSFSGTVISAPHFFYGSNTHAMHEAFNVRSDDGRTLEVVDNVKLAPRIPVTVGDHVAIVGELIPMRSRGRSCTGRITTPLAFIPTATSSSTESVTRRYVQPCAN